jgi:integrase
MLKVKVEDVDLKNRLVMIPHLKYGTRKKCPQCGKAAGKKKPFCSHCGADISNVTPEGIEERSRLINIGSSTASLLKEYLENRVRKDDHLFPLTRQRVGQIVRDLAERAGISGRVILNPETGKKHYVHPHSFRDSLAVDWLLYSGDDISKQKALQEHLGHKRFDTTMRYFKIAPAAVRKIGDEVQKQRGI